MTTVNTNLGALTAQANMQKQTKEMDLQCKDFLLV